MKAYSKQITLLGMSFLAICFTTSCVNNIADDDSSLGEQIPITISSPVLQYLPSSRMTGSAFEDKDSIGLYVVEQPESLSGKRYLENIKFTKRSDRFEPELPVYYPPKKGKCDFYSYYPYRTAKVVAGKSTITVAVNADQSTTAGYYASDFLVAKELGISPSNEVVKLPHSHKMCKLNLVVELKGDAYSIEEIKTADPVINLQGLFTEGVYDFANGQITALDKKSDMRLFGAWRTENGKLVGKSVIAMPQVVTGGTKMLKMQVDGRTFSGTLPADLALESGKICTLTFSYNHQIGMGELEPSIKDWADGDSVGMDGQEEKNDSFVSVSANDFEETSVISIMNQDNVVAMVCKEYLRSATENHQAVVVYPAKAGTIDWQRGRILHLLGSSEKVHGGTLSWNMEGKSFTYVPGNMPPVPGFYIVKDNGITFDKPEIALQVEARKCFLTDARGTEVINYPIVKIGTQYWTRSNLCTRKFTDGTTLPLLDEKNTVAGYREHGTECFYSQNAIGSDKFVPAGWSVPAQADWEALLSYVKNDVSTLKSGSLWKPGNNNLSGFGCELTGLFTIETDKNVSYYDYGDKYSAYWSMMSENKYLLIKSDPNEVKFSQSNPLYALSVRFVRNL